jgi:hypothetical protein
VHDAPDELVFLTRAPPDQFPAHSAAVPIEFESTSAADEDRSTTVMVSQPADDVVEKQDNPIDKQDDLVEEQEDFVAEQNHVFEKPEDDHAERRDEPGEKQIKRPLSLGEIKAGQQATPRSLIEQMYQVEPRRPHQPPKRLKTAADGSLDQENLPPKSTGPHHANPPTELADWMKRPSSDPATPDLVDLTLGESCCALALLSPPSLVAFPSLQFRVRPPRVFFSRSNPPWISLYLLTTLGS